MAKWVFMVDEITGNIGLFDEPTTSGDATDPNSARNDPLNDPENNLQYIYWHIQFDNMEVNSDDVVTVNHGTVAVAGTVSGGVDATGTYDYSYTPVETVLKTHSLGYEPMAYVAIGDDLLTPGYIVQMNSSGAARYVSVYVTTTQVIMREWAQRGTVALGTLSQDYRVIVIKNQPASDASGILIDWDQDDSILTMGEGRFDSSRRYLQVVPGGTPFGLAMGRTLDLHNGAPRFVAPDGTTYDPVPATTTLRISTGIGSPTAGSAMNYTGSFTGDTVIQVQAP